MELQNYIPEQLRGELFERLFETAEIAKFTPAQLTTYEDSLKAYRDMKNSIDTASKGGEIVGFEKGMVVGKAEGKVEGKLEGLLDVAKNATEAGFSNDIIATMTKLTDQQINEIRSRIK